jgi:membrane associated rhomboid family serine protease
MDNPEISTDHPYKKYIPWLTIIFGVASIILFAGINLEPDKSTWDVYRKWGSPLNTDIWNGDYWGLITSNFLHVEIWHIAFNLYWFWFFGKKIEFESSKLFYALFILSAGIISSLAQLTFSVPGIGLSGIVYAQFGYILALNKTDKYAGFIDKKTINWLLLWLVFCIVMTYADVWRVGNAAHIGGFLWGLLSGKLTSLNKFTRISVPILILALFSVTLFWQPWSIAWVSNNAYNLHTAEKLDEAEMLYKEVLRRAQDGEYAEFAKKNLQLIRIKRLSSAAYKEHEEGNYKHARELYLQILAIDSANQWAKDNMNILPD